MWSPGFTAARLRQSNDSTPVLVGRWDPTGADSTRSELDGRRLPDVGGLPRDESLRDLERPQHGGLVDVPELDALGGDFEQRDGRVVDHTSPAVGD